MLLYLNDRNGWGWVYNPSTLALVAGPLIFTSGGPSTAALALDTANSRVYLPGGYAGAGTVSSGITFNVVNVNVFSTGTSPAIGTPSPMPTGSFRPTQAVVDSSSGNTYIADYSFGLTGWTWNSYASELQLLSSHNTFTPGSGNGALQAQGVASNGTTVYTCCQSGGQDCLATCNFSTGTFTTLAISTLALSSSYTNMAYDSVHGLVFITSNYPGYGLTSVNVSGSTINNYSTGSGTFDSRGICINSGFIFVCNFGSNNLSVFQQGSGGVPSLIATVATGTSPNAVACSLSGSTITIYVTNFNGTGGGVTVYQLNTTGTPVMSLVGNYLPNQQFVSVAVG